MESLTNKELVLVQRSCSTVSSQMRQTMWPMLGFIVVCVGAILLVSLEVYELVRTNSGWEELRRTVGFVAVLIGLMLTQWMFARHMFVARSTIVKLYRESHCVNCGRNFEVDKCAICGADAMMIGPDNPDNVSSGRSR